MNKNLKKVISTVAALAVSASSFVALAAQSFPDVAETATYAQAVNELTSLGVIDGYTDGTFGPDKLVTRAEITKMIVVALGQGSTGVATTGQDTEFTDVPGTHWASGYVSVGVSTGFINGMGDGTFAPDSNVQYAQAVKMLVSACGYGSAATNAGGYPSGYMTIASQNSMLTGLSGVSNSTELNRGQVAQLIDNAMKMPLTLTTGNYNYDAWGNQYPETKVYDGTGDGYQTLLTKMHDTYVVYGRVTETSKSGSVDSDKVKFRVEKADNFDDEYYNSKSDGYVWEDDVYYGDTDAPDLLFTYAEALLQEDDNGDFTILSIAASGSSDVKEVAADDYDADDTNVGAGVSNTPYISFYTNAAQTKHTSYDLDDNAEIWVNGQKVTSNAKSNSFTTALNSWLSGNNVGTVTLIDETETGSTTKDGYYDKIFITYYADATFDQLYTTSSYTRVQFQDYDSAIGKAYLEIDTDDDDKSYDFVLGAPGEGTDITYTDLKADDVLSIAYDVTESFENSDFYDVYVSRDVVSGKVTSYDDEDETYTVDGTDYELSSLGEDITGLANPSTTTLDNVIGSEYTLYLNVFGRISAVEEGVGSVDDIAIVESLYMDNDDTWTTRVIRADGVKYEYPLKNSSDASSFADALYGSGNWTTSDSGTRVSGTKQAVQNRVIKIKVNSSGEITYKGSLGYSASATDEEYKSSSDRIGSVRLDDATVILDFTDYSDADTTKYGLMSKSSLVNEGEYTAYGYEKSTSSSTYRYVIVTEGNSGLSGESDIAVLVSIGTTSVDDTTVNRYKVYTDGQEKYLSVDPDEDPSYAPSVVGEPFFYTTNSSGYINEMYQIVTGDAKSAIGSSYSTFVNDVLALSDFNSYVLNDYRNFDADGNEQDANGFKSDRDEAGVSFGPVMDRTSSEVQLASNPTELSGKRVSDTDDSNRSFSAGSSTKVYTVKVSANKDKVEAGTTSSVVKSSIASKAKYDYNTSDSSWTQSSSGVYVAWSEALENDGYTGINFALVKEFENELTDVVVYTYE